MISGQGDTVICLLYASEISLQLTPTLPGMVTDPWTYVILSIPHIFRPLYQQQRYTCSSKLVTCLWLRNIRMQSEKARGQELRWDFSILLMASMGLLQLWYHGLSTLHTRVTSLGWMLSVSKSRIHHEEYSLYEETSARYQDLESWGTLRPLQTTSIHTHTKKMPGRWLGTWLTSSTS